VNETAARNVLLVRALETGEVAPEIWSDADRAWASRAAAEVVGADATRDEFLSRRAALVIERVGARHRSVMRTLRALKWRDWVGWAVVVAAFVLGIAIDAIGPGKRINILAFPLFGLLAWNLIVYGLLGFRAGSGLFRRAGVGLGPLARAVARVGHAVGGDALVSPRSSGMAGVLASFSREWAQATTPLVAARVARVLHLAAAVFALGAIAGLYLRGIVFEYRAGWESTFLGPESALGLLSFVLAPSTTLTGIALPDVEHFAALRFSAGDGENAAPWIHLYATTIALAVLLPRLLLALWAWIRERRLARRFPVRLEDAYFQRLLRTYRGEAAQVRAIPYGYVPSPRATLALNTLVGRVFGPHSVLEVTASVPFGGEDAISAGTVPEAPLALVVALFPMTATPESENQGAFIDALVGRLANGTPLVALVDASGFARRFADEPQRQGERRDAWRRMLADRSRETAFADLEATDLGPAELELTRALDRAHVPGAAE
jgi:hypothetical protein